MFFKHQGHKLINNPAMLVILLSITIGLSSCGQDSAGSEGEQVTITSVAPSEVAVGDTLTISGTHFGASGSNRVIFIRQGSETIARPFAATSARLQVVVPDAVGEASVTVKVGEGNRAATPQGVTITASKKDRIVKQYIKDPHFKKGFKLTPLSTDSIIGGFANSYVDTLGFGNGTSSPIWRLTQWWSDYSLEGARPTEADDGSIVYSNPGKKVALYQDHSLLLEVNASREYDHPRKNEEHWVHLLISQGFKSDPVSIAKVDEISFSMELQLVKAKNKMAPEDYDPHLHTAHTPFYFRVRNTNINSKDHNDYIYFGIRSYDYRHPTLSTTGGINGRDRGGNKLMYQMPTADVWGQHANFGDKQWHRGKVDIKPYIKKALKAAHERNAFTDTEMGDLKITSMNFGWEVPGTFDSAIKVKNISLKTVRYSP